MEDLDSDGVLEPIGSRYAHGFNILLAERSGHSRLRFTIAHELCHTFFYEFVPELKFVPHGTDPGEERLCDFGAAELLMPAASVQKAAKGLTVCTQSLCKLAAEFSVSITAMFLRLRSLRLWNCVFSEWDRLTNGSFVLSKFYGGKRVPWEWEDASILSDAWQSYKPCFGNAVFRYRAEEGSRYFPARFEVRRLGDRILSLWGSEIKNPVSPCPLFDVACAQAVPEM
jgi:hypothetical protein